jgi:hypothetical protein
MDLVASRVTTNIRTPTSSRRVATPTGDASCRAFGFLRGERAGASTARMVWISGSTNATSGHLRRVAVPR